MILFFVRRFNDIDHTAPIVYRLAKDGYKEMVVLASDPQLDIENDFRLNFLKMQYNIEVNYSYRYFVPTLFHKIVGKFICKPELEEFTPFEEEALPKTQLGRIFRKMKKVLWQGYRGQLIATLWKRYFRQAFLKKIVYPKLYGFQWACQLLKEKNVSLLVFDWHNPNKLFNHTALFKAGKQFEIPIVGVPYGLEPGVEKGWWKTKDFFQWSHIYNDFNSLVVQDENYKQKVIQGGTTLPPEKIHTLGSTRFCYEWNEVLYKIVPELSEEYKMRSNTNKVKVVFMDHSAMYRLKADEILETIRKIEELDFVDFVLKPSTGSPKFLSSLELYNITKVDYKTLSINLIQWADVVMGTTSSILLEPLLTKKTLIVPSYLHDYTMLWETMNACWRVDSYQELEEAFYKIAEDRTYKPYSDENADRVITEIAYNGHKGRDVLGDHASFLLSQVN